MLYQPLHSTHTQVENRPENPEVTTRTTESKTSVWRFGVRTTSEVHNGQIILWITTNSNKGLSSKRVLKEEDLRDSDTYNGQLPINNKRNVNL